MSCLDVWVWFFRRHTLSLVIRQVQSSGRTHIGTSSGFHCVCPLFRCPFCTLAGHTLTLQVRHVYIDPRASSKMIEAAVALQCWGICFWWVHKVKRWQCWMWVGDVQLNVWFVCPIFPWLKSVLVRCPVSPVPWSNPGGIGWCPQRCWDRSTYWWGGKALSCLLSSGHKPCPLGPQASLWPMKMTWKSQRKSQSRSQRCNQNGKMRGLRRLMAWSFSWWGIGLHHCRSSKRCLPQEVNRWQRTDIRCHCSLFQCYSCALQLHGRLITFLQLRAGLYMKH